MEDLQRNTTNGKKNSNEFIRLLIIYIIIANLYLKYFLLSEQN